MTDSVGIVKTQYAELFTKDKLKLDCGRELGPITVAYETYGELSAEKDNAILICHALSGDAHVAGRHSPEDKKPGWWDNMVGPGKGIDTNKYFVICSNVLGGCKGTTGPGSINPETGRPYGLEFPMITISDMVRVQKALMDYLGITQLLSVIGGSMGGMQVLEWAVSYPEKVFSAIPIATTSQLSAQAIAFNAVGRNAILADPDFNDGQYYDKRPPARGLAIARMVGHITYLSEESMHRKFGRTLRYNSDYKYDFSSEFAVETYLDYQGQRFVERFDANSYLYITRAMDYFDLAGKYGSLEEAFSRTDARFLIISFSSDWLFPPEQSRRIVRALLRNKKDVSYCNVHSLYGHDAFLLEPEVLGSLISGFLDSNMRKRKTGKSIVLSSGFGDGFDQKESLSENRYEYPYIEDIITPGSRVLDLGCGDGSLLSILARDKDIFGLGIEIKQDRVVRCVQRGISVIQHDIDEGLDDFVDDSFDYAILSQTLPEVRNPELIIKEMLRVARTIVVTFPNFAHISARLQLAFGGKAPVTTHLPSRWYNTERIRFLSMKDFEEFCSKVGARIIRKVALGKGGRKLPFLQNLLAQQAIYILARAE